MGGVLGMAQVPAVHLKCVAIIYVFLVQAASVGFVPLIPTAPSLRVAVAVDADLTVWVIHVLVTQIADSISLSSVVTENARTIHSVMILLQPLSSAQCVAFSSSLFCSPCAFTALAEGVEFTMVE